MDDIPWDFENENNVGVDTKDFLIGVFVIGGICLTWIVCACAWQCYTDRQNRRRWEQSGGAGARSRPDGYGAVDPTPLTDVHIDTY